MAREQRHDVDYFPHGCNHGRKMHIIEDKYGNDGYAVWFKLLEQIGKANHHYIDVSDDLSFMYLVSIFKVSQSDAESILSDLSKLGAINKDLYLNHRIIYSDKFIESISDAYKKRRSKPLKPSEIIRHCANQENQSAAETIQSAAETIQSDTETYDNAVNQGESIPKGKESKVKESKGEGTRALNFLKTNYQSRIETDFLLKYASKIENKEKFRDDFNDTVDQEGLEYTDKILFARLGKYARNWIENQQKFKSQKTSSSDVDNFYKNIPVG